MSENYNDYMMKQQQKINQLEQQRKSDIYNLVMILQFILPATYIEILEDLGMQEYIEIYAVKELLNRNKK